jgi:UDP-N-acetylglucosamine:LPS N-acetylglucosamine transferase
VAEDLPEVILYVVDAGGGHRATANALAAAAAQRGAPFRLTPKNITDVLAPLDPGRRFSGHSLEELYNAMVRRQMTRHLAPLLRGFQWLIRRLHEPLVRAIAKDLCAHRPALVLSLFPNFNRAIKDAVRLACPEARFQVLLTDYADMPPGFWIEPGLDGVIVATDEAARQAAECGIPPARIVRTSGMVLHPRFYPRSTPERRRHVRRELGLPEDEPVVLVLFGGKGSPEMAALCRELLRHAPQARVIAVCGDNRKLLYEVSRVAIDSLGRLRPMGFTDGVADLMAASDLLLAKPGPGTLAEAFHQRLPVIVCCNDRTIPQERFNARYLVSEGLGVSVEGWPEMACTAGRLLSEPEAIAAARRNLARLPENRAVYEVLDLIADAVAGPAEARTAS